jgi:hypothetical protein
MTDDLLDPEHRTGDVGLARLQARLARWQQLRPQQAAPLPTVYMLAAKRYLERQPGGGERGAPSVLYEFASRCSASAQGMPDVINSANGFAEYVASCKIGGHLQSKRRSERNSAATAR